MTLRAAVCRRSRGCCWDSRVSPGRERLAQRQVARQFSTSVSGLSQKHNFIYSGSPARPGEQLLLRDLLWRPTEHMGRECRLGKRKGSDQSLAEWREPSPP